MAGIYEHLKFEREQLETARRSREPPRFEPPHNPKAHGRRLGQQLRAAVASAGELHPGYDPRLLLKLEPGQRIRTSDFTDIVGVEIVSEEGAHVVLVFATEQAVSTFEERLAELAAGRQPTRKELLYVLNRIDTWVREDRVGPALQRDGFPADETFVLDVELWPVAVREHDRVKQSFQQQLEQTEIEPIDQFWLETLALYRVRVTRDQAEWLLQHRDVRRVDLPPRFELDPAFIHFDLAEVPEVPQPPADAPVVAVLDSGLVTGHPLIGPAVADAQTFFQDEDDPTDHHGHGTAVAGIALYGDVAEHADSREFVPMLRVLSGKLLDDDAALDMRFVENQLRDAVDYFASEYDCRVFNLSLGDRNRPYLGGHLRGLAVTLDTLARMYGVLFVVSVGNYVAGVDELHDYPEYLFDKAAVIDPATALNALTVGSIANVERGRDERQQARRGRQTLEQVSVARAGEPSPFTRTGPSINGAIKPDVVVHGGNMVISRITGVPSERALGRLTMSHRIGDGKLLAEVSATSYAAPHVSHLAARLFDDHAMNPDVARALIVANATPPPELVACVRLNRLQFKAEDRDRVVRVCGYGEVDDDTLFRSADDDVTLLATAELPNKSHHFYHVPVPAEFFSSGQRRREVIVSLAHTPPVRSTRMDYRASRIFFNLIEAPDLEAARAAFDAATAKDDYENIAEVATGRTHPSTTRNPGTVQCSRWVFKTPTTRRLKNELFVVVTRNDPDWGEEETLEREPYALVVKVRDRENATAQLYARIRAQLEARARGQR